VLVDSELLRPEHGDEEVEDQAQSDDSDNDVFSHGLELSTRVGVNDGDGEERHGDPDVNEV
jgi:hypothetical protein